MGDLRIRDVDETIVLEFKARARRHGHTLGEELRELLAGEAVRPRREAADRLRALRESVRQKHGLLPDSTPLVREMRDARG